MPADSASRTIVLSVVALDMVGYSRASVAEQMSLKDNFNQALVRAIRHLSVADRIILDTGDGVAMGFLGDPEDALYVAMFMQDAVNRVSPGIRIGINLGPVKLSTGIGGHPNIIGDGINVAERIMTFAEPGQCTVSRPFYELMSRVSGQYAGLFEFVGVRTDKQIRAHDVYLMQKSAAAFQQARQGVTERAAQRSGPAANTASPTSIIAIPAPVMATSTTKAVERYSGLIDFLEDGKKVAISATFLAVIAVGLGATLALRKSPINAPENAAPLVATAVPSPVVSVRPNPGAVIPAPVNTSPAGKTTSPAPIAPPPASAVAQNAPQAVPPKAEIKSAPTPAPAAAIVAAPSPIAAVPSTPKAAVAAPATMPGSMREKPLDAKIEKSERIEKASTRDPVSDAPRKPAARTGVEREQTAPLGAAPVVPTFQAPQQAPRTESVAPTPAASPAPAPLLAQPAPAVSTEAIVVTRSAPPFPVEGIRQGLQTGFVKARLTIDARGNVSNVEILESKPIPAFGRETRNTTKEWKFNTGTANRTYDIEFTFKL